MTCQEWTPDGLFPRALQHGTVDSGRPLPTLGLPRFIWYNGLPKCQHETGQLSSAILSESLVIEVRNATSLSVSLSAWYWHWLVSIQLALGSLETWEVISCMSLIWWRLNRLAFRQIRIFLVLKCFCKTHHNLSSCLHFNWRYRATNWWQECNNGCVIELLGNHSVKTLLCCSEISGMYTISWILVLLTFVVYGRMHHSLLSCLSWCCLIPVIVHQIFWNTCWLKEGQDLIWSTGV